jgi:putative phage-type endonuclease
MDDLDASVLEDFFKVSTVRAGTLPSHTHYCFKDFSSEYTSSEDIATLDLPYAEEGETLRHYYYKHIHRTPAQCVEERTHAQRSEEWKSARKFALTASDFGAAAGTNPFETGETLLDRKLTLPFQGNAATAWGSAMESKAAEAFLQYAQLFMGPTSKLYFPNLIKYSDSSWMAVSPDGVLHYTDALGREHFDLVEFKCPTKSPTGKHPYARYEGCIPPYYASQMLGIWGYCNSNGGIPLTIDGVERNVILEKVWFVVWQPSDLWVSPFHCTPEAYEELHFALRKWYFELFLPRLYERTP